MNGKVKYSLDTNIVSEILRENEIVQKNFRQALQEDSPIYICSIVYYEIVRGLKTAGKFRLLRNFLELNSKLPHLMLDKDNYETISEVLISAKYNYSYNGFCYNLDKIMKIPQIKKLKIKSAI